MQKNLYKCLFFFCVAAFFIALPFLTPTRSLATEMLIFAIFALGYDIVFGYTGLLSFGHAIFFGIGATRPASYSSVWSPSLLSGPRHRHCPQPDSLLCRCLPEHPEKGHLLCHDHACLLPDVLFYRLQMDGPYRRRQRFSRGPENVTRSDPTSTRRPLSISLYLPSSFSRYFSAFRIVNSPFGRVLKALKENEDRARSIGYNTTAFKTVAFMISAFFANLAGGLYAVHSNFVPMDTLSINTSADVVIMALLGGIGTLYGPVMGAMLIVLLKNLLSDWIGNWNLVLGAIFIVSVLSVRQGIFPVIFEKLKEKLCVQR